MLVYILTSKRWFCAPFSGDVVGQGIQFFFPLVLNEFGDELVSFNTAVELERECLGKIRAHLLSRNLQFATSFLGIEVEPAALYTLEVSATITDDADFENNLWELVFATNAQ